MPDKTILLIDFDPKSIENALRSLTGAGYMVEVANDGLTGLEAFGKLHPDLVLIEPMVPRKHGFEVCKEIKQSAQGHDTPVLITTGFYTGRKHHSQAKKLYGCDDYLEKPVSDEMLLSTCRRFLEEPELVSDSITTDEEIDAALWEEAAEPASAADSEEMPSLDNLTEEEIVAHLDALIVEQSAKNRPEQDSAPEAKAEPEEKADLLFEDEQVVVAEPVARVETVVEPQPVAEPEAETGGSSKMPRLLLIAAGIVVLIAAGTFASMKMMKSGDSVPAPAVETVVEPEVTIAEDLASVEVTAQKIESPPPQQPEPAVERSEPPPRIVKQERVPKPRVELLPDAPFTELDPAPEPVAEFVPVALQAVPAADLGQEPTAPPIPKARFGELVDITEVDSTPVPLDKQMPAYNPIARRFRHEGTVLLRLLINEHGMVEQVEVTSNNAGDILEKTAVDKAQRWTYQPAEKDGVAVKVWILEKVVFKL